MTPVARVAETPAYAAHRMLIDRMCSQASGGLDDRVRSVDAKVTSKDHKATWDMFVDRTMTRRYACALKDGEKVKDVSGLCMRFVVGGAERSTFLMLLRTDHVSGSRPFAVCDIAYAKHGDDLCSPFRTIRSDGPRQRNDHEHEESCLKKSRAHHNRVNVISV